mmetsp:Transcript_25498/g.33921  ORF Transcript_25498/g.33921 Transcript_25498/m.33921 type:complete len:367 (+) Transcript_25498:346-1446(+)
MIIALGASLHTIHAVYLAFPEAINQKCFLKSKFYTPFQMACKFQQSSRTMGLFHAIWQKMVGEETKSRSITASQSMCLLDATTINGIGDTLLHNACRDDESLAFISLLLEKYPAAAKKKNNIGDLPLHQACRGKSSHLVILLLLNACPEAARTKNNYGEIPLDIACWNQLPAEVLSLLLASDPNTIRQKNKQGNTPLHTACISKVPEEISLLLQICPTAARERNFRMETLLHIACKIQADVNVLTTLLDTWPEAVFKMDSSGKTPLNIVNSEKNASSQSNILVGGISHIFQDNLDIDVAKTILYSFIDIGWWNGVARVFSCHTAVIRSLDIHDRIFPRLLSVIGRRCALMTVWEIVCNRQDLITTV